LKKLILIVGLVLSFEVFAQSHEPSWKSNLRIIVSSLLGEKWGLRFFGEAPSPVGLEIQMPPVPQITKKSTDVTTYTKKSKEPTEYDQLPAIKRRQFDYAFIKELYQSTRKAEPKDEDLSGWLNTLDQGGSREGIYQGLVLDEVYSALENVEERPTKKLLEFTLKFSQKFLNQTIKVETLETLNLYSLKRILTEKGLDLIEFYETKDLDELYRWYAVYSSDLAKAYGPFLGAQVRQNKDSNFHYLWAKKMPLQHIKSEFIIKLHKVMNELQSQQDS